MDKFGRNYILKVETDSGNIEITLPFTLNFSVDRNIMSNANTSKITILNLSENIRKQIYKDRYDTLKYKGIELRGGYGDKKEDLPIIFKGNIKQAYSERVGTEYETRIEAYDGGFAFLNGYTDVAFSSGTPQNQVLDRIIADLPNVNKGIIGGLTDTLPRGNSYSGNSCQLLDSLTNGHFFIDNENAYCLLDNECIEGNIQVITSASGLLGSPLREDTFLTFRTLFEPRLLIGQIIELNSQTENNFNGQYKVIGFKHNGIISSAISGTCITTVSLYFGTEQLKVLK